MPFDGTNIQAGVVRLFDDMLEFFGPDGERWVQGMQLDEHGNRCLVGALKGGRARLGMSYCDDAAYYLRTAIRKYCSGKPSSIMDFNDAYNTQFDDIRAVILIARDMAERVDPHYRDARQMDLIFGEDERQRALSLRPCRRAASPLATSDAHFMPTSSTDR